MTGINIPATIVVPDSDVIAARADLGDGFFIRGLSETGEAPPTHWMSSGDFWDHEMDRVFEASWERLVRFSRDWQVVIDAMGLKLVGETAAEDTAATA